MRRGRAADPTPTGAAGSPASKRQVVRQHAERLKNYAVKNVSSADRHQLLTYIAGYTGPEHPLALVVHPAPDGPTERDLRIEGPRGRMGLIKVLGLDTRTGPETAVAPLRKAIAEIAASTAPL
ncbi:hypothetical protein [Streptomyces sp. MBT62]|uniref:hypothetical protein n=1 Tax=Streptomyces sp. MBT62 TaxID=2800410 RepID=UPI00190DE4F1|nr:hypothetical protein [Streptomyces sp. MBT62]MBK3571703.1 hypothetical protein [Streptomyces sp. MBT62]